MHEVQAKPGDARVAPAPSAQPASVTPATNPAPAGATPAPQGAAGATAAPMTRLGVFQTLLWVAYPFAVYLGLTRLGPALTAAFLGGLALLRIIPWFLREREQLSWMPLLHGAGLLALATVLYTTRQPWAALVLPVLVSLGLLGFFAGSLRFGTPVVETIARRMDGELSDERRAYCRSVTQVWCVFFTVNAALSGWLALAAPLGWWTIYTGVIAYALMGALFLGEFVVRRRRFPPAEGERGEWSRVQEKGSVLGLQIIWFVCRVLGRGAVRTLIRFVALYFVLTDSEMRRVSREFQQRVGLPGTFGDVYRHVLRFSFCIVDRLFLLSGRTEHFEFETSGDHEVRAFLDQGKGVILVGAHFGSFEALRAIAMEDDLPLSIVGFFENAQRINALLQALAPEFSSRVIHVEPGAVGHMMTIRERIRAGELVGFLGDRMTPGVEGVRVQFMGAEVEFPTGAFVVAAALSCPVFLVFCVSEGANRYVVHCEKFDDALSIPRAERAERIQAVIQRYASRLEEHVRAAPDNWFNFYDFFSEEP